LRDPIFVFCDHELGEIAFHTFFKVMMKEEKDIENKKYGSNK
jgi:hypothetical protein